MTFYIQLISFSMGVESYQSNNRITDQSPVDNLEANSCVLKSRNKSLATSLATRFKQKNWMKAENCIAET